MQTQTEAEEYKLIYAINDLITQLKRKNERDVQGVQMKNAATLIKEVMLQINKIEIAKPQPNFVHHAGELITYLKDVPMDQYLPATLKKKVDTAYHQEVALDYEDRLTEIFCSLIEHDSAGEASQKNIMEIRRMIREGGLGDEVYAACRLFLNAKNVVDTYENIKKELTKLNLPMEIVSKILKSFYVEVGCLSGKKRFCPCCGREWSRNHLEQSPVCNYYYQSKECWDKPLEKTFEGNKMVIQLVDKVVNSIVMPNLGEIRLRDRLLDLKNVEVVMYPGCDDYDLQVIVGNQAFLVDLKDFAEAAGLVQHITHDSYGLAKLTEPNHYDIPVDHVFLVIPKHRLSISENPYLSKVKTGLKKAQVQVASEDEFVQKIQDVING